MRPHDAGQADDLGHLPPELLALQDVARVTQLSPRHVLRMVAAGQMPAPLRIGRCARWSRDSIRHWITSGCPKASTSPEAVIVTKSRRQPPSSAGRRRRSHRTRPD